MKKLIVGILCLLLITGCSSAKDTVDKNTETDTSSSDSLDDSFYSMINLGTNVNRESYYTNFNSTDDFQTIGRELQVLSTEYYSTSEYYMSEGLQFAKSDFDELLGRPENHDYSLQPSRDAVIEDVTAPIMVESLYEQDYYTKSGNDYTLSGLSFAISVNPTNADGSNLSQNMSDETISEYGRGLIEILYNYVQTQDDLKDLPILITIYQGATSHDAAYSGHFIYSSYCQGSVGEIRSLDYHNVLFTSSEASEYDPSTASQFSILKNNIKNGATESVGIVGYGRYRNGELTSMKIQMTVNTKTYTELIYMVQLAADEIDSQFSGFDVNMIINDQDGLKAIVVKKAGEDAQSTLLY